MLGPALRKGTGCRVPSRWREQRRNSVKVGAYRSCLPKVTRRGRSMSTSGRSSGSVDWSGFWLQASLRPPAGSCESSVTTSSVGNGSSPSGSIAAAVSNWSAGSASASTPGSFPTEGLLGSDTYRWLYGWGHTSSCGNESSNTCRNSSTGSPSGETQFSTKGTTKGHVRVAFSMSINCPDVRQEQASAAGYSRPGIYHSVRLYSSRNRDQHACRGVSG